MRRSEKPEIPRQHGAQRLCIPVFGAVAEPEMHPPCKRDHVGAKPTGSTLWPPVAQHIERRSPKPPGRRRKPGREDPFECPRSSAILEHGPPKAGVPGENPGGDTIPT